MRAQRFLNQCSLFFTLGSYCFFRRHCLPSPSQIKQFERLDIEPLSAPVSVSTKVSGTCDSGLEELPFQVQYSNPQLSTTSKHESRQKQTNRISLSSSGPDTRSSNIVSNINLPATFETSQAALDRTAPSGDKEGKLLTNIISGQSIQSSRKRSRGSGSFPIALSEALPTDSQNFLTGAEIFQPLEQSNFKRNQGSSCDNEFGITKGLELHLWPQQPDWKSLFAGQRMEENNSFPGRPLENSTPLSGLKRYSSVQLIKGLFDNPLKSTPLKEPMYPTSQLGPRALGASQSDGRSTIAATTNTKAVLSFDHLPINQAGQRFLKPLKGPRSNFFLRPSATDRINLARTTYDQIIYIWLASHEFFDIHKVNTEQFNELFKGIKEKISRKLMESQGSFTSNGNALSVSPSAEKLKSLWKITWKLHSNFLEAFGVDHRSELRKEECEGLADFFVDRVVKSFSQLWLNEKNPMSLEKAEPTLLKINIVNYFTMREGKPLWRVKAKKTPKESLFVTGSGVAQAKIGIWFIEVYFKGLDETKWSILFDNRSDLLKFLGIVHLKNKFGSAHAWKKTYQCKLGQLPLFPWTTKIPDIGLKRDQIKRAMDFAFSTKIEKDLAELIQQVLPNVKAREYRLDV
ncbi:hypothetical protein O181_033314 [Austropuccinia psidii MF-1]|uniref:Uncharacterized protein n=1 Tax=Austropuccinia psidii MF-1 TaxID=1389203 RepID=A0A9Q3H8F9_9BASI|nr:hypothetical protein [Austropuccinia psidii MF-1]